MQMILIQYNTPAIDCNPFIAGERRDPWESSRDRVGESAAATAVSRMGQNSSVVYRYVRMESDQ